MSVGGHSVLRGCLQHLHLSPTDRECAAGLAWKVSTIGNHSTHCRVTSDGIAQRPMEPGSRHHSSDWLQIVPQSPDREVTHVFKEPFRSRQVASPTRLSTELRSNGGTKFDNASDPAVRDGFPRNVRHDRRVTPDEATEPLARNGQVARLGALG